MNGFEHRLAMKGLVAVAREVVAQLERDGLLNDDRYELAMALVERWTDGVGGPPEAAEACFLCNEADYAILRGPHHLRAACHLLGSTIGKCSPGLPDLRDLSLTQLIREGAENARRALIYLGVEPGEAHARVQAAFNRNARLPLPQ